MSTILIALVAVSFLATIALTVFGASNRELLSEARAKQTRRKGFAVLALLCSIAIYVLWLLYSIRTGNWLFMLIAAGPIVVRGFETTLRKKTKLAVPEIDGDIGTRLIIKSHMFQLVRVEASLEHGERTISAHFVDERSLERQRTIW